MTTIEDTARRVLAEYERAGHYLGDHRTAAPDLAREVLRVRVVEKAARVLWDEPCLFYLLNTGEDSYDTAINGLRAALAATDDERRDR